MKKSATRRARIPPTSTSKFALWLDGNADGNMPAAPPIEASGDNGNDVALTVDDAVRRHSWVEPLTQWGWVAKSVVYALMGVTAIRLGQRNPTDDEASPEGSVAVIANASFGRLTLGVLTVGLLLYVIWRAISVAVITGNDLTAWGDRIGYTFSAVFYVTLAWTAGKASFTGLDPQEPSTVEDLSRRIMEVTAGRTMVGIAGLITMGVGLYFAVHKGIGRSFTKKLAGVSNSFAENEPKRKTLLVAGVVGWVGRGIVTLFVGYFLARAAWRFDADDANGFDQSLRAVAGSGLGGGVVIACGTGLIAYGVFCLASARFRRLGAHDRE